MGTHIQETFYEQLNFFILCEFLRKEKEKKAEFQPIKFLCSANLLFRTLIIAIFGNSKFGKNPDWTDNLTVKRYVTGSVMVITYLYY